MNSAFLFMCLALGFLKIWIEKVLDRLEWRDLYQGSYWTLNLRIMKTYMSFENTL